MTVDWFTFCAQIVNFVVLVVVLNHFLYRPIMDAIAQREESFNERLSTAMSREEEADELRMKYETKNQEMDLIRQQLLDEVYEDTDELKRRLLQEVRDEVQHRRENWFESLRSEQDDLISMVTQKSGEQVTMISAKALEQLATQQLEQQTIDTFLEQLANMPENDHTRLLRESLSSNSARIETAFGLSPEYRGRLTKALSTKFGISKIEFATNSDLVMGVSLCVGSIKTGWNVQDYLDSISDKLQKVVER